MTKRLIDLDDELLAAAQRELGTATIADTVRTALRDAVALQARRREITWLTQGGLTALADAEQRASVWR